MTPAELDAIEGRARADASATLHGPLLPFAAQAIEDRAALVAEVRRLRGAIIEEVNAGQGSDQRAWADALHELEVIAREGREDGDA